MATKDNALDKFFYPSSIAVAGASGTSLSSFGTRYLAALIKFGFTGRLYAVNPAGGELNGSPIYRSIVDIPDGVDLVVVTSPARFVPGVLQDSLKKGIGAAVVLSAGFRESGEEGRLLEDELVKIAAQGLRIIGPNCFGVYCPGGKVTVIPGAGFPRDSGGTALMVQSGQLSETIIGRSIGEGIRFSRMVSYGNACDVNECDLLEYYMRDNQTNVIMAYNEGVRDGRRFLSIAREHAGEKPLIILKAGLSSSGSAAAASHTGSMAGDNAAWEAFFRQSGAVQARSMDELIDMSVAFNCLPAGCGSRMAMVSGGGAGAVLGADACEAAGLLMPAYSPDTDQKLRSILPAVGTAIRNPLDIGTPHPAPQMLSAVLEAIAEDHNIDAIVIRRLFLSAKLGDLFAGTAGLSKEQLKQTLEIPVQIKEKFGKPVVVILQEDMPSLADIDLEAERRGFRDYYFARGLPVFLTEERAFKALAGPARFGKMADERKAAVAAGAGLGIDSVKRQDRLAGWQEKGQEVILDEVRCKELLKSAGIEVIETRLARSREEALALGKELGYPLAMKVVSPQITHKSDAGGVKLDIRTAVGANRAYDAIMKLVKQHVPEVVIEGVSVQKMATKGVELVIGMIRDPQFGPMLMFGLGGIFVEVLRDVSFRIVPLSVQDASQMIREIKGYRVLQGFRGQEAVNLPRLEQLLLRVSRFVELHPEIREMDINPVIAYSGGTVAVDARIVLEPLLKASRH
jgi:acyl-CoA synthetase (NDP forming)